MATLRLPLLFPTRFFLLFTLRVCTTIEDNKNPLLLYLTVILFDQSKVFRYSPDEGNEFTKPVFFIILIYVFILILFQFRLKLCT